MDSIDQDGVFAFAGDGGVRSEWVLKGGRRTRIPRPVVYNRAALPISDVELSWRNRPARLWLHHMDDAICLPHNVFMDARHRVLPPTFARRRTSNHGGISHDPESDTYGLKNSVGGEMLARGGEWAVSIDTDYSWVYGHVLLDSFSRLWAMGHLGEGEFRVVTSSRLTPGYRDVFGQFGIGAERLVHLDRPMRFGRVTVPDVSVARRTAVHGAYFEVLERIGELGRKSEAPVYDRIYLSRSKLATRALVNEAEIEALMVERGYEIYHPQDHPLRDQMRVYAHAREIVAPGGSAAHIAVFAPRNCDVLILASTGWLVNADMLLNRWRGRLGYVFGDPVDPEYMVRRGRVDWRIDAGEVADAHRRHFGRRFRAFGMPI